MPADGIGVAVKKQDFGTSRWQLADNLNVRDRSVHHYPYCRKGNAARSLAMMPGPLVTGVMSGSGVRRDKAALSSGCKPHPATRSSRKQSEQSWR